MITVSRAGLGRPVRFVWAALAAAVLAAALSVAPALTPSDMVSVPVLGDVFGIRTAGASHIKKCTTGYEAQLKANYDKWGNVVSWGPGRVYVPKTTCKSTSQGHDPIVTGAKAVYNATPPAVRVAIVGAATGACAKLATPTVVGSAACGAVGATLIHAVSK